MGNYTGTVVRDNVIYGGFASDIQDASSKTKGQNKEDAIIKSVAERSIPLRTLNRPPCTGSASRLDLDLGSVTDTSKMLASLAQFSAIT